jgi:hypothetical protein
LVLAAAARSPNWGLGPAGWPGFAYNSQHAATSAVPAQSLVRIKWSTPVDLQPPYSGSELLIHYGSPVITPKNTVVIPVKTVAGGGFRVEARHGLDGSLVWSLDTDYIVPPHNWFPECGPTLTPAGAVAIPASGGTVLLRANADTAGGASTRLVFFGASNYAADPATYDANVCINTPITTDRNGTLYFGFVVLGPTPINLQSGIARVTSDGVGAWVSATAAANDPNVVQVPNNCAPALGFTQGVLYVGARTGWAGGYLLCLDSATLSTVSKMHCVDPLTANDALLYDDGTASPTVTPDGQVFYGVLDNPLGSNHLRGWLLHFDAKLTHTLPPGAFGWDHTPSIVPRAGVPSYTGSSPYLLLTKYNNYVEGGGDGVNKVGVLDPGATQTDPVSGITVMREIMTIAGPTPDPGNIGPSSPNAVREWCINSAAVDWLGHAGLVNNEDGKLYRWDFTTNALTEVVTLTSGLGEAYTPTVIGPDGTVYAINNATLFAVGQ